MNAGDFFATFGVALLVLSAIVVAAVIVALIYLVAVRLSERRSHRRSLPSGMSSNPNRFARFDEEGEDQQ